MSPVALDNDGLRAVIDSLAVGVVTLDADGCICHCNQWLVRHGGLDANALTGEPFTKIFPESLGTRLEQAIEHAIRNHLPSLLSPALHGTLLPLYQTPGDRRFAKRMQQLIHVMPLPANGPAACLIQVSDMTANISRERLLRQQTETLRRTTTQDSLTGTANRRRFNEILNQEFHKAQRDATRLALIMVDIDGFSEYNALYGRERGDACLVQIAATLQTLIRPNCDLVARYGGEEFALILPGLEEQEACHLAENIRLRICALGIENKASPIAPHLTASLGLSVMRPNGEADTHTLVSSADVALFQAKNEGRNRAIHFSAEDGSFKLCG